MAIVGGDLSNLTGIFYRVAWATVMLPVAAIANVIVLPLAGLGFALATVVGVVNQDLASTMRTGSIEQAQWAWSLWPVAVNPELGRPGGSS